MSPIAPPPPSRRPTAASPASPRPTSGRDAPRVVVIGAGLGGLAAAARLAHRGYRVTVVEQHQEPGGRAGIWRSEGFTFDTGPSLILMLEYWRQLFADVDRRLEDYLDLVQVDPNYRIHYPDGSTLEMTSRLNVLMENVERLEPGAGNAMLGFLAKSGDLYRKGVDFIDQNLSSARRMFDPAHAWRLLRSGSLGDLRSLIGKYFKDDRLKAAVSFQSLYLGLSPYESMAIYSLLPFTEIAGGLFYPMGGIHQLPMAVERLAREHGADFRYGTRVTGLDKARGRVTGVRLADGTSLPADIVVTNADLPYAYDAILGEKYPGIDDAEFSCSVVLMYLGVSRTYPQILHHNLVVAEDMEGACHQIFREHRMPESPPYYICASTRTDPSAAPPGCENLFILVLAPSQDPARPIDWSVEGPRVEARMLERLEQFGLADLRKHIVTRKLVTPSDFTSQFGNLRGEAFGLSHGLRQIGYFRPHNRHATYQNLYFVGQSTHPGCGVPIVLISARLVAERIAAEQAAPR